VASCGKNEACRSGLPSGNYGRIGIEQIRKELPRQTSQTMGADGDLLKRLRRARVSAETPSAIARGVRMVWARPA
jgi:hypothetical protein